jgi:DNA helicase-2/ATP-dependent DNA helicase PcrA
MSRGESILRQPRITLSTIHGVKGGECDNVVLITDVSYKVYEELQQRPDDELRVFYVAVTRAKENLYIVEPRTQNYFDHFG